MLLATGGTLMSLAESGAGTLAGNAQSDVWHSIVARDSAVIAQAVNRALLRPYLERTFPGQPAAVQFGFDFSVPPTPKKVFEVAALAKQAGYVIDVTELEEQTGYTLKVEEQPQGTPMPTGSEPRLALPFANKDGGHAGRVTLPRTGDGEDPVGSRVPRDREGSDVLAAFAQDTGPAADAVRKLLDNPTPDAAAALLKDLPSLIPDDPALAAVIADAMAEQFGKTVANKEDHEILEIFNKDDRAKNGRFDFKGTGDKTQGQVETKLEKRQRSCKEALAAYHASKDHPSADDVASGKVDIREALSKGFEATFGGQKVVFFTQEKIGDKYDGRGEHGRIDMIRHVLAVRSNMFPVRHSGEQIGLVERLTSKNSNRRHVVTIDWETGIAVNVMRCSDDYIRKHYHK